jgi:hypothetical protein
MTNKIKLTGASAVILFLSITAYSQMQPPRGPQKAAPCVSQKEVYHINKLISEKDKDAIVEKLKKFDPNSYSVVIYTSKGRYAMGKGLGSVKQQTKTYSDPGSDAVVISVNSVGSGDGNNSGGESGLKPILSLYK